MRNREIIIRKEFVTEIKTIIGHARESAIRSVDFQRVRMYWHIGQRIFEEEQQGKERAEYGTYLIKNLAKELEPEFGSGFSIRILEISRRFYRTYPIANTLYSQLNWSQYRLLVSIENADKREYYQNESVKNAWTKRQLERQVNSGLYERLLLSNNKEAVLAVARSEKIPDAPQEIIKDPMVLEFLGLHRKPERNLGSGLGLSVFNIQATGSQAGKPMPTPRAFRGRRNVVAIVAYEK